MTTLCKVVVSLATALVVLQAFAGEKSAERVDISGHVALQAGQVVFGHFQGEAIDHRWRESAFANIAASVEMAQWLHVFFAIEGEMWFPFYQDGSKPLTQRAYYLAYLDRAEGVFSLEWPRARLDIGIGYDSLKYNPESRNLGEYLFRSDPYPPYVLTSFDRPYAHLLGLHVKSTLFGLLNQHVLVSSSTDHFPLFDFAISWLADITAAGVLHLGVGVSIDHAIPVDDSASNDFPVQVVDANNDTLRDTLTFRGTKLMARACFDPKPFFSTDFFKDEDLKLYTELAVLGVRNYAKYYDTLWQRIPLMVGLNVPAHPFVSYGFLTGLQIWDLAAGRLWEGVDIPSNWVAAVVFSGTGALTWALNRITGLDFGLDIVSAEVEWWASPYPNTIKHVAKYNQPYPIVPPDPVPEGKVDYGKDNWKWSLYLRKDISRFSLIGQVANDHTRYRSLDEDDEDYEQTMAAAGDWYYMLKLKFSF